MHRFAVPSTWWPVSHKTTRFLAVTQLWFKIKNPAKCWQGHWIWSDIWWSPNGSLVFGQLDLNLQLVTGHQWSFCFCLVPPKLQCSLTPAKVSPTATTTTTRRNLRVPPFYPSNLVHIISIRMKINDNSRLPETTPISWLQGTTI